MLSKLRQVLWGCFLTLLFLGLFSEQVSAQGSCGDGFCYPPESCATCSMDCGTCATCGDGQCNGTETCSSCSTDCGPCVTCGDGVCTYMYENCLTCSLDCGACETCGDGQCNGSETCTSCPSDCGACMYCGDGFCDTAGGESCSTCSMDCETCETCGDGQCNWGETCSSCSQDCGLCEPVCGDGVCNGNETCSSCSQDCGSCGSTCGNGVLEEGEVCDDGNAVSGDGCSSSCSCDGRLIDFSTIPGESPASGLEITTQFKGEYGVTFSMPPPGKGPTLAKQGSPLEVFGSSGGDDVITRAPDMGLYFLDGEQGTDAIVTLTFDSPASAVLGGVVDLDSGEAVRISAKNAIGGILGGGTYSHVPVTENGDGKMTQWIFQYPSNIVSSVTLEPVGTSSIGYSHFCFIARECGDGACNGSETCSTCSQDCGACTPICGDGSCNGTESCSSCRQDCGACQSLCGDSACNGGERCSTCPNDCGICSTRCGDDSCNGTESCETCDLDCGKCPPGESCGNGVCNRDAGERCSSCVKDCGACSAQCGDGTCNGNEDCGSCVLDCGVCREYCGDGACNEDETCSSCVQDCGQCTPTCGDGECSPNEDCGNCTYDCGTCPEEEEQHFCPDGVCQSQSGENCNSCAADCGTCAPKCGDGTCESGETSFNCSKDCGIAPPWCGNEVCDLSEEDCFTCAEDCDICPTPIIAETSRVTVRQLFEKRTEVARDLVQFLSDGSNRDILEGLPQGLLVQIRLLAERKKPGAFDGFRIAHIERELTRILNDQELRIANLSTDLFKNSTVRQMFWTLPGINTIILSLGGKKIDLQTALDHLPQPKQSLEEALAALNDIQNTLGFDANESAFQVPSLASRFIRKVFAQGQSESELLGPKDSFQASVELLERAAKEARNPRDTTESLEDRIAYLQARKQVLSGIINMPSDELSENLDEVGTQVSQVKDRRASLRLFGIVKYIRSSGNFRALESSFASAASRMNTGFGRMISLFAANVTPRVQAEELLSKQLASEHVSALQEESVDRKRLAILAFAQTQNERFETMLKMTPPETRESFKARYAAWESEVLAHTDTSADLRDALKSYMALVEEMIIAARSRTNTFFRMVYSLQDFFDIRT